MRSSRLLGVAAVLAVFATSACRTAAKLARAVSTDSTPPATMQSDGLLLAAAKLALPPAGFSQADLPEPGSLGATAVGRYCVQCHSLPTPGMHSATDWPSVIRRMWLRMDRLPPVWKVQVPDAGERNTMLTYLTTYALQVSGSALPAGPGRTEFSTVCSRCHALPDPWVHSSQDWASVVMRMERNMERMNVAPATPEQVRAILSYLQGIRG